MKIAIMLQKEVNMKTKLLLIAFLAIAMQVQANAAVTVEEASSPMYLKNNGYSAQTADTIQVNKARANGAAYYTEDEEAHRNHNKFVRFWRNLYIYADPAANDNSYYHHDTKEAPSYTDL